jgi:hypothetical protein
VLNAQNYETATASDWTCPSGSAVLKTGDATYGIYAQCYPSGSGNRSCYKSVTFGYEAGTGYTTADMATAGYNIELDFVLVGGNCVGRSESQFIVPTTGPNLATNNTYSGTDYIFALTQPLLAAEGANAGKAAGNTGTAVTTWYINDLTNATTTTIELNGSIWYHLKLVVTATSVAYTITNNSTSEEVATGSKTVSALPSITGFFDLLGRGSGKINFDNLEIYDYTAALTVTEPTFTFKAVNGANRIYTLANPDAIGKLYYTTTPAESAPAVGDAAYTSSDETSLDVSFGTSGKYYAYVLHSNGTTTSAIKELTVTAGELTLATPVFTVVGMVQAADGFYYPQVTFSSDNSSLEGAPTATFDVTAPYTFTEKGSVTVTASATGYTSSSNTFTVANAYIKSKTIDFGALTASDFDPTIWETATGAPRDYWTNRAAAIPADVTYYKLTNTSTTKDDPDNSAVLDGITISNYYQRAPEVYIGYGLLTPYTPISGGSNNMNFTVNGATADDYIVYNGWNNYGSGTFNTVQAGNATFGLYRYDTMLRTINVFSPAPATVSVPVTSAGFATYANHDYALDFTGISGLKAFTATVSGDVVTFTPATQVPAGTGLLLKGETNDVPVIASAAAISDNVLYAPTAEVSGLSYDDGTNYNFILSSVGDKIGFFRANNNSVAVGKAYLQIPQGSSARQFTFIGLDGTTETTGINSIAAEKKSNEVYNLQGQRMAAPQKGLYIMNGKKVVLK